MRVPLITVNWMRFMLKGFEICDGRRLSQWLQTISSPYQQGCCCRFCWYYQSCSSTLAVVLDVCPLLFCSGLLSDCKVKMHWCEIMMQYMSTCSRCLQYYLIIRRLFVRHRLKHWYYTVSDDVADIGSCKIFVIQGYIPGTFCTAVICYALLLYVFHHGLECIMQVRWGTIHSRHCWSCLFHDCDRRCVLRGHVITDAGCVWVVMLDWSEIVCAYNTFVITVRDGRMK